MTILSLVLLLSTAADTPQEWTRLRSLPDAEGFAGMFAGVSHGVLLAAGGANFPDKKPWEGGTKAWTDVVYALDKPAGEWKHVGKLPRHLGYGVSVTYRDSVVCVGGCDADRHYSECFRLVFQDGKLSSSELPSLPQPLANASGVLWGDTLIIAGGLAKPDATETSKAIYRLDLAAAKPKWNEIEGFPGGGRMLSVAAVCDDKFWLMGGVDLAAGPDRKPVRRYLKDAYSYDLQSGWKRIADLPHAVTAAPSPAPADSTGFTIFGGDDGTQLNSVPTQHRGFRPTMLHYDLRTAQWIERNDIPAPRVTTPCVRWNDSWVVPSGEVRPGVRSPEVWRWIPRKKE